MQNPLETCCHCTMKAPGEHEVYCPQYCSPDGYYHNNCHEDKGKLIKFQPIKRGKMPDKSLTEQIATWESVVAIANHTRKTLNDKPDNLKIGYRICPEGILNAYREGDLNFKEATEALESWHKAQISLLRSQDIGLTDEEITKAACGDELKPSEQQYNPVTLRRRRRIAQAATAKASLTIAALEERVKELEAELAHTREEAACLYRDLGESMKKQGS